MRIDMVLNVILLTAAAGAHEQPTYAETTHHLALHSVLKLASICVMGPSPLRSRCGPALRHDEPGHIHRETSRFWVM